MWLSRHQKTRKAIIHLLVIVMAVLLLIYPLEASAKRPLVRIHHDGVQGHVSSSSGVESVRHDASDGVERAQDSLERARNQAARVQSEGPSSQSPNSHYRDVMESQGNVYDAESDLREQKNREYWERRR